MGVSAQYTGMAGKTANCQIGVFPTYAGAFGEVLVDRELYLPKEWTQDAKRRAQAGVPEQVTFQTRQQLAECMIERFRASQLPVSWVTRRGHPQRLSMLPTSPVKGVVDS